MARKSFISPAQARSSFATEEEVTTGALALHGSSLTTDGTVQAASGADLDLTSPAGQDIRQAPGSGRTVRDAGDFAASGDAEASAWVLRNSTTDATPTALYTDGTSGQVSIASGKVMAFEALVVAKGVSGTNANSAGVFWIRGLIKNIGGTTTLVNTIDDSAPEIAGCTVAASADDTNDALELTVTGDAATTIRWVADLRLTEVSS